MIVSWLFRGCLWVDDTARGLGLRGKVFWAAMRLDEFWDL